MEAVYGWVKNIIYYMIFLAVVNNLLADSKYEKYIRFFAGMVLILLVVSPLTGRLRLDQQISSMFQSISLYNDANDLKSELWEMDDRRYEQIMGKYGEAVEQDIAAMAQADGLTCVSAQVQIDQDRNSSTYGQVKSIRMEVTGGESQAQDNIYMGSRAVNVDAGNVDSVVIEPVTLGQDRGRGKNGEDNTEADSAPANKTAVQGGRDSDKIMNHLTGKVAQYYGLEESHIEVQWKDD